MNELQPIRDKTIVESMINYAKLTNERNYIFLSMGFHSGLRVSDLLRLKVETVRDQMHVNYIAEKTKKRKKKKKQKMFIIHHSLAADLASYIQGMDDDDYLFASRQCKTSTGAVGEPINRATAWRMINKIGKKFGLRQIGCHTLRKTWGYHLYTNDPRKLALLMMMFGHETQTETLGYLGLTQDEMDTAIMELSYT